MKMGCKYLTVRSHKNKKYFYCRLLKSEISLDECCCCENKEHKQYKKLKANKSIRDCKTKHKLTKQTEIKTSTKKIVWERDNHKCMFCGKEVPMTCANSHYIKRSHNGKGIEQNLLTNCIECHNKFDDSIERATMLERAKQYLQTKYENWNEDDLIYKKY